MVFQAKDSQKKVGVIRFMLDKTDLKPKKVIRDQDEHYVIMPLCHYIMTKRTIHQRHNTYLLIIYSPK